MKRFQKLPLEKQLFYSFVSVSLVLLLLTMGIMLYFDMKRQLNSLDQTISSTAAYIAELEGVQDMLERGYPDPQVSKQLDSLSRNVTELNVIVIYNTTGMRFYHTDRRQSGETFVQGDEEAILQGSEPYITTGYGTYGTQRQAFHAVKNSQGEIIGFVMTSIFTADILARNKVLVIYALAILAVVFVVGLALSRGIVQLLKGSLKGHHPYELLELYLRQADVLNAIEDGLIATDLEGKVIFSNQAALKLLGREMEEVRGQELCQIFPESCCLQVARTGAATHNRSCVMGERQVLSSEIPIRGETGLDGVLSVLHDKTEMMRLSDELSGTRNTLDTLRFFNHEFMNKLHVILGYLQTGQVPKAISFIVNSSLVTSQAIRETADCIRVSRLCALVIGKMMHAAELGILLTVAPDSYCRSDDLLMPEGDYVTVVGNLLENAIEELARQEGEVREVRLALYCRPDCNIIVCEDTGQGIPPGIRERVLEKGVSSKGEGRGLGLPLIRQIVEEHGGNLDIVTETGAGTCFTITLTQKET